MDEIWNLPESVLTAKMDRECDAFMRGFDLVPCIKVSAFEHKPPRFFIWTEPVAHPMPRERRESIGANVSLEVLLVHGVSRNEAVSQLRLIAHILESKWDEITQSGDVVSYESTAPENDD